MPRDFAHRRTQLVAGDVVAGRFVVERTIGIGGMGQVVAARHQELGTRVAIKVIRGEALGDPDSRARFKREAKALAKLTSVHAVRVYDVGETEDGLPYIIMEHLEGRDLASLLSATGPLPVDEGLDFMIQACDALTEAHDAGIVHRDLKPQNLFVSKKKSGESHIRVLDFGLVKAIEETNSLANLKLTRPGEVVGTVHYMAPEQLTSSDVGVQTDVWAVGATLFRLLTGKPPFPGATPADICTAILGHPPLRLLMLRPDSPPAVEEIVLRCLEKDPARRFPDVRRLRAALESARRPRTTRPPKGTETTLVAPNQAPAGPQPAPGPAPTPPRAPVPSPAPNANVALAWGSGALIVSMLLIGALAGIKRVRHARATPVGLVAVATSDELPRATSPALTPIALPAMPGTVVAAGTPSVSPAASGAPPRLHAASSATTSARRPPSAVASSAAPVPAEPGARPTSSSEFYDHL